MAGGLSLFRHIFDDADPRVKQDGVAHTSTWQSEFLRLGAADYFGIIVNVSAASGTNPTLDIAVDFSPDGGTTFYNEWAPDANVQGQAALDQITGTGDFMEAWPVWFPLAPIYTSGDGSTDLDPGIRFQFTIGGTSPSFTTECFVFARKFGAVVG